MRLEAIWYGRHPLGRLLAPIAWLYGGAMRLRRALYVDGVFKRTRLPVPVIVVGNLSVGGTGKTPMVIYLAALLRDSGRKPGVISRGYGGRAKHWPQRVTAESDPVLVGDEPVLIAQRCACPVVVDPDRVRAAQTLLAEFDCDVLISDDGLQHYALRRDVEIAVIDSVRRHGNGRCLPAGPLREPLSRLRSVDVIFINGTVAAGECGFVLCGGEVHSLDGRAAARPLTALRGQRVHAVAAIGRPGRFFDFLRAQQLQVEEHPFPDHHIFSAGELEFSDDAPVLMTEKDAVKYRPYAGAQHLYVPVEARLDPGCEDKLRRILANHLAGLR